MGQETGTTGTNNGALWHDGKDNPGYNKPNNTGLWEMIDDYFTGKPSQERAHGYEVENMERQHDWDIEARDWNAWYNSDEQALQRWIEAGGNPNAYFAKNGAQPVSMQNSASSGSAAGSTAGILQSAVTSTAQAANSFWQNRLLKAQAEGKEIENGTLRELNEATIAEIRERTRKAEKEGKLSEANAKVLLEMLPYQKGKTSAEIEKMENECNLMLKQQDEINARIRNLNANTRKTVLEKQKLEWEKTFRDTFGVDPNSPPIAMLIQNILSGKGANIIQTFFNYLNGVEEEGTEQIKTYKPKTLNGKMMLGLAEAIRDGYKAKYTKRKDWRNH